MNAPSDLEPGEWREGKPEHRGLSPTGERLLGSGTE